MFITSVLTILMEATQAAQQEDSLLSESFSQATVLPQYPVDKADFPSIWVDFTPESDLKVLRIGDLETSDPDPAGNVRKAARWLYEGVAQFTVLAMTSLERARLMDALVALMAEAVILPDDSVLRTRVETNDLVGIQASWGALNVGGWAESQGTPWQSDEMIYEATLSLPLNGEFIWTSDQALVPLSSVIVDVYGPEDGPPPEDLSWL